MVSEPDQIDPISLAVVGIYLPIYNESSPLSYSPRSRSYRETELSSHPATRYFPSCDMSSEFTSFCYKSKLFGCFGDWVYKVLEDEGWLE
jgi:hypothetical protein